MTFLTTRYTPPSSRARAEISPMEPGMFPSSMSERLHSGRAGMTMWCRGVAVETPSTVYRVRAAGNRSITKARAARAGLKMFCPSPPHRHLTITIAKTLPKITTE